eukprot:7840079-Alexandrium_andersonii.AAC.1
MRPPRRPAPMCVLRSRPAPREPFPALITPNRAVAIETDPKYRIPKLRDCRHAGTGLAESPSKSAGSAPVRSTAAPCRNPYIAWIAQDQ